MLVVDWRVSAIGVPTASPTALSLPGRRPIIRMPGMKCSTAFPLTRMDGDDCSNGRLESRIGTRGTTNPREKRSQLAGDPTVLPGRLDVRASASVEGLSPSIAGGGIEPPTRRL